MHHDRPRPAALRPAQPNSNLADQLERITPRFDELTQRARLGVASADQYNELEEIAQGIARDILAPFRGAHVRAVREPSWISSDSTKAVW